MTSTFRPIIFAISFSVLGILGMLATYAIYRYFVGSNLPPEWGGILWLVIGMAPIGYAVGSRPSKKNR